MAIVDLDVHQGNGTARIFQGDDSVFTLSLHGAKNFPFRKEAGDLDVVAEVDEDLVAEVLAASTGIPVFKLTEEESARLLRMEDELHKRVIGQEQAIKSLSQAIRRTRAGLKDPKRPGGSFIFAGPSGVGKTELSKTLAEFLFGDEDALISLDMSEYSEKHTVSRLFGSPPGYVGYEEGGLLISGCTAEYDRSSKQIRIGGSIFFAR